MLFVLAIVALAVSYVSALRGNTDPTGTILSAQFYCELPCQVSLQYFFKLVGRKSWHHISGEDGLLSQLHFAIQFE